MNCFIPVHIGLIGVRKVVCGVSFLADKRYKILFKGRSSHAGASTEKGKNASNIISDNAQFELDLRGETDEICEYLRHQAQNIINGASIMYGIEHEISFVADAETAINSAELIAQVRNVCLEVGFEEDVLFPGVTILHKIAKNKLKEHVAIEM